MIIDCHAHISKFAHEGKSFAQVRDSLLLSMEKFGIDYSFVHPDSEPDTILTDLDATREIISGHPKLLMLGTVSIPKIGSAIIDKLDLLAEECDIIGIKLYPGFELFYPDEERCHPIYEVCKKHDIPVVFHSGESMGEPWREKYNHPNEITKVAKRFPTLKIIVAHFSQPHLAACRELVLSCPNVHVDISGLAHPDVIKICGKETIVHNLEDVATQQPEKVIFGTDWPICDVGEHLQLVSSLPISETAKALILSRNAERIFSLDNVITE